MSGTARLLVALSLVCGLFYPLLWGYGLPQAVLVAVKGAAVGSLAVTALLGARSVEGWLLALLLAFGATGDVLLEIAFGAGAAAFAAGHVVSILLYLRNRRVAQARDWAIAAGVTAIAAAIPAALLHGRAEALPFTVYAALLGAMAASAWLSRFPRGLVALGALLFVASDMLIAARMAMAARPFELGLAIWILYYSGQLLIFVGVFAFLPPRERSSGGGGPPKVVEG